MTFLRSLSTKIILSYLLVGGLFVTLLIVALLQFHALQEETLHQQEVVAFFDAIRNARRLEKNFLLYAKDEDIAEAIEQSSIAADALASAQRKGTVDIDDADIKQVSKYEQLLREMAATANRQEYATQSLLTDAFETGGAVLRFGTKLNTAATDHVREAFDRHHSDLLRAIYSALALVAITGLLVARSVVNPLRQMEANLHRIAKGEAGRVADQHAGPEINSLARSINETIHEIESRQENQARTSRLVALGTMLSGVAHELNNPLANISSSSQILIEEWEQLPEHEIHRLLEGIDEQIGRAKRIVSSLLDFSSQRRLIKCREPLMEMVEEAVAMVERERSAIRANIAINQDAFAFVDRHRFQQVLVNLIKNALDAAGSNAPITIRAEAINGEGTIVEVIDSGPGVPLEIQHRIFDPFYTTKPLHQGTGLGLAIAHEVISQHGGTLSVISQAGSGATFRIQILAEPA